MFVPSISLFQFISEHIMFFCGQKSHGNWGLFVEFSSICVFNTFYFVKLEIRIFMPSPHFELLNESSTPYPYSCSFLWVQQKIRCIKYHVCEEEQSPFLCVPFTLPLRIDYLANQISVFKAFHNYKEKCVWNQMNYKCTQFNNILLLDMTFCRRSGRTVPNSSFVLVVLSMFIMPLVVKLLWSLFKYLQVLESPAEPPLRLPRTTSFLTVAAGTASKRRTPSACSSMNLGIVLLRSPPLVPSLSATQAQLENLRTAELVHYDMYCTSSVTVQCALVYKRNSYWKHTSNPNCL